MSQNYSYTFKLINSVSIINLPFPLQNARSLKIKFVRYNGIRWKRHNDN